MVRSGFKRPAPRPAKEYTGAGPTPRTLVLLTKQLDPKMNGVYVWSFPKENALQHRGYMNLVRGFACLHCFKAGPSQFCHADEGKGTAIKTDCRRGFPACPACHYLIGSTGKLGKDERRKIEALYGKLTRGKVRTAGLWPKSLPEWAD